MSFPARNLELIACTQGKAADFDITLTSTAGSLTVAAIEEVRFYVKALATDPDAAALITKSLGSGVTLTGVDGSGNVLGLVQLTTTDTEALTAGRTYAIGCIVDSTIRGDEQAFAGRLRCDQPIGIANS